MIVDLQLRSMLKGHENNTSKCNLIMDWHATTEVRVENFPCGNKSITHSAHLVRVPWMTIFEPAIKPFEMIPNLHLTAKQRMCYNSTHKSNMESVLFIPRIGILQTQSSTIHLEIFMENRRSERFNAKCF